MSAGLIALAVTWSVQVGSVIATAGLLVYRRLGWEQ